MTQISLTRNPLLELPQYGQSVWIDDIRRAWLDGGQLAAMIADDAVSGVTSNPSIFEKAIREGHEYDAAIRSLSAGRDAAAIADQLMRDDIVAAADLLRPVYDRTTGRDGYVSLEVSPHLARDAEATVREARRLWDAVDRPNLMIKVPATREGIPAVRDLLASGINVNITLIFSPARYVEVAEAWLEGLEHAVAAGREIGRIASVASFFVSRIDTLVDAQLAEHTEPQAAALAGKTAIAYARLAYQHYRSLTRGPRWDALVNRGAMPQRLLWASTSTKNPAYADTMYVDALIGRDTVNTMPSDTLSAYRDHGAPLPRLEEQLDQAATVPAQLVALGIDPQIVEQTLETQGLEKFVEPFDRMLAGIAERASALNA